MARKATHPVLLAQPVGPDNWRAWCPFCVEYHHHGAAEGHRVAHCADKGHFPNGYVLKLDPRFK